MTLGEMFGKKKQEVAETDAARQQAQETISKTKSKLDARFSHLEELVSATLLELHSWNKRSDQLQEKKH